MNDPSSNLRPLETDIICNLTDGLYALKHTELMLSNLTADPDVITSNEPLQIDDSDLTYSDRCRKNLHDVVHKLYAERKGKSMDSIC